MLKQVAVAERVRDELESGIILFLQNKRMQTLNERLADYCYGPDNGLNFLQAQQCENHYKQTDYALNA